MQSMMECADLQEIKLNGLTLKKCIDEEKKEIYLLMEDLKPGRYKLENLNGPLKIFKPIVKNVELEIVTSHDIIVQKNLAGKIVLTGPHSEKNSPTLYLQGSLEEEASLSVYFANVEIAKTIKAGSKIVVRKKLKLLGHISRTAEIKCSEIEYDARENPHFKRMLESDDKSKSAKIKLTEAQKEIATRKSPKKRGPLVSNLPVPIKPVFSSSQNHKGSTKKVRFSEESDVKIFSYLDEPSQISKFSSPPPSKKKKQDGFDVFAEALETDLMNADNSHTDTEMSRKEIFQIQEQRLNEASQLFAAQLPKLRERLKDYIREIKLDVPFYSDSKGCKYVLDHQYIGLQKLLTHLLDKNIGYYHWATGAGKTIEQLFIIAALNQLEFDVPTLIVVSRTHLIKQTLKEFKKLFPQFDVGIFDGDPDHKQIGKHVTITTYPSLQRQFALRYDKRVLTPEKFRLLLLDEAHHALAKDFHDLVTQFFSLAIVLGFSATDSYNGEREEGALQSLEQLLGTCIHRFDFCEAIDKKVLTPCVNVLVNVNAPPESIQLLRKSIRRADDFSQQQLEQLNRKKINNIAVDLIYRGIIRSTGERLINKTGIINVGTIAQAAEVEKLINSALSDLPEFKNRGVRPAAYISSNWTSKKESVEDIFDLHEQFKIAWLIFVNMIEEGYDNKNDEVLIRLAPTLSNRKSYQTGGRIPRSKQGKLLALIIEFAYGINQVFFNHAMKGKMSYGEIPKIVAADIPPIQPLPNFEVENYSISSDMLLLGEYHSSTNGQAVSMEVVGKQETKKRTRTFVMEDDDTNPCFYDLSSSSELSNSPFSMFKSLKPESKTPTVMPAKQPDVW